MGGILANLKVESTHTEKEDTGDNKVETQTGIDSKDNTEHPDNSTTVSEMSSSHVELDSTSDQNVSNTTGGTGDLLTVPEAGTTLSSGASSKSGSNVSLENVELEADISELESAKLTEESVHITEWNVAHSLKLRDTEFVTEGSLSPQSGERNETEKEEEEEEEESESSEDVGSPDENLSIGAMDSGGGIVASREEKEEEKEGNGGSKGEGMSWWTDAMAESQNEIDNLDALVEKCEDEDSSRTKELSTTDQSLAPTQSMNGNTEQRTLKQSSNGSIDLAASERRFEEGNRPDRISRRSSTDSINSIGKKRTTGLCRNV